MTRNASCDERFYFFFQAEDGIRDLYVTGVQTCALPILLGFVLADGLVGLFGPSAAVHAQARSEERRVGKGVDLGGRRISKKKKRSEQGPPATLTGRGGRAGAYSRGDADGSGSVVTLVSV